MIPGVTIEFCDEEDFRANRKIKGRRRRSETTMKSLPVTGEYTSGYVEVVKPKEDKKE